MARPSGRVSAFLLDAFPARPFGGNVAGVVLLEDDAPDAWMQAIAAELAAPTTGFVHLPSARDRNARVRFFTPTQEIDACGHVTVAIATVLAELGVWPPGPATVVVAGGSVPLLLARDGDGVAVELQQVLQLLQHLGDEQPVNALLGGAARLHEIPLMIAGTGLRHLLIALASVDDLSRLPMEAGEIAAVSRRHAVDTIGVFAIAGPGPRGLRVRMRDLCAGIGAIEEPASGTTTATVALALAHVGLLNSEDPRLDMEMGVEMGRPSRLAVELDFDGAHAVRARLRGCATQVLAGTLAVAS